ncbi:MAG: hypothetical protein KC442_14965 [Thermomicrobiales bacterium]|nr:hypothetical protein [Thermomicrobiales bacterium]
MNQRQDSAPAASAVGIVARSAQPADRAARQPQAGASRNVPLIVGLAFVAVAGLLLAAGVFSLRAPVVEQGLVFTIPAGASANVARPGFDSAITIPTDIRFASPAEAVITVHNLDDVQHRAGPFLVGAGQTFTQRFSEPGRYPIVCTVDPLETVVVTVEG